MLAIDRWRKRRPADEIFDESPECEPTKLTEPAFVGFGSSTSGQMQKIGTPECEPASAPTMPAGVRLVHWEPKPAPVQLSRCTTVTDTEKFIRTTLRQLEARLTGKKWLDGGWSLSGLLERLEACGCTVRLENQQRLLQ